MDAPKTTALTDTGDVLSARTAELARFFPGAEPVRIRAIAIPARNASTQLREPVLIEFASAQKAIFSSSLPLEFGDRVQLKHADGNGDAVATVIAVQYDEDRKAIAVEFADGNCSWVKRP